MLTFDIDGEPIPPEHVYPHSSGQLQIVQYRESNLGPDDDTPPPSPVHGYAHEPNGKQSNLPAVSTSSSGESNTARNHQPKMKDVGLNTAQTYSVHKHPSHLGPDSTVPLAYHFRNVATIQQLLDDLPNTMPKPKYHGFDPEDLLSSGTVYCTPCRPSDLKYAPKLSIFMPERFHDCPEDVFEVLKPSLALAENIILKGAPKFWVDIACGKRVVNRAQSIEANSRMERLHPVEEVTLDVMKATIAKLQKLGSKLTYRWRATGGSYGTALNVGIMPFLRCSHGYRARGEIWSPDDTALMTYPADPWKTDVLVDINDNFYATAKSLASLKYPDPCSLLRFTFFFSVNLLHELAHAFEAKCGASNYYNEICEDRRAAARTGDLAPFYLNRRFEAQYKDHESVEAGASFEIETFGGRVHPINNDFGLRYGLNVYLGNSNGGFSKAGLREIREFRPYGRSIPMGFIEELLQQAYWNQPNPGGLSVPRFGARAYTINTTSTLSWRDFVNNTDLHDAADELPHNFDDICVSSDDEDDSPVAKRQRSNQTSGNLSKLLGKTKVKGSKLLQTKLSGNPDKISYGHKSTLVAQVEQEQAYVESSPEIDCVDAASEYQPPSPRQPAIDDYFSYVNDHMQDDEPQLDLDPTYYDALLKPAALLTLNERWLLLEEYASIVHGWDSSTFLARRMAMDLAPIPESLIPTSTNSWNEDIIQTLQRYRDMNPQLSFAWKRGQKMAERTRKQNAWRVVREMEELVVLSGGSRILFMRNISLDSPVVVNFSEMTFHNFDAEFRPLLISLRDEAKTERLREVKEATKVARVASPASREDSGSRVDNNHQSNKITGYLVKLDNFTPTNLHPADTDEGCQDKKPNLQTELLEHSASEKSDPVAEEEMIADLAKQMLQACRNAEGEYFEKMLSDNTHDTMSRTATLTLPLRTRPSRQPQNDTGSELWEVEGRRKRRR